MPKRSRRQLIKTWPSDGRQSKHPRYKDIEGKIYDTENDNIEVNEYGDPINNSSSSDDDSAAADDDEEEDGEDDDPLGLVVAISHCFHKKNGKNKSFLFDPDVNRTERTCISTLEIPLDVHSTLVDLQTCVHAELEDMMLVWNDTAATAAKDGDGRTVLYVRRHPNGSSREASRLTPILLSQRLDNLAEGASNQDGDVLLELLVPLKPDDDSGGEGVPPAPTPAPVPVPVDVPQIQHVLVLQIQHKLMTLKNGNPTAPPNSSDIFTSIEIDITDLLVPKSNESHLQRNLPNEIDPSKLTSETYFGGFRKKIIGAAIALNVESLKIGQNSSMFILGARNATAGKIINNAEVFMSYYKKSKAIEYFKTNPNDLQAITKVKCTLRISFGKGDNDSLALEDGVAAKIPEDSSARSVNAFNTSVIQNASAVSQFAPVMRRLKELYFDKNFCFYLGITIAEMKLLTTYKICIKHSNWKMFDQNACSDQTTAMLAATKWNNPVMNPYGNAPPAKNKYPDSFNTEIIPTGDVEVDEDDVTQETTIAMAMMQNGERQATTALAVAKVDAESNYAVAALNAYTSNPDNAASFATMTSQRRTVAILLVRYLKKFAQIFCEKLNNVPSVLKSNVPIELVEKNIKTLGNHNIAGTQNLDTEYLENVFENYGALFLLAHNLQTSITDLTSQAWLAFETDVDDLDSCIVEINEWKRLSNAEQKTSVSPGLMFVNQLMEDM